MEIRNDKLFISQRNINRLFYGTHKPWQVLRNEGAQILVKGEGGGLGRLGKGEEPSSEVVGIDLMDQQERYLSTWGMKFITTTFPGGSRVKEVRIAGLPPLVADDRTGR